MNLTLLRAISFGVVLALPALALPLTAAVHPLSHTLVGTWACYDNQRPHTPAFRSTIRYAADGAAAWSGFGLHQRYRYALRNGILTLSGPALPGPLSSRIRWTRDGYQSAPLSTDSQLGESCTRQQR